MVYLVDDTPLEKTGQYIDLGEYADVIERIGEASPDTLGRMSDAECVLIHSSFTDKLFIKAVKRDVCGFGDDVPLVLFSDGNPQEVEFDGDRFIVSIRKDRMYSNLGAFLQRFRIDRKPDLKILAYGEHYGRERASALAGAVLSAMMFQPGEEVVDPAKVAGPSLEGFVEAAAPGIGVGYAELLDSLAVSPMTASEFRSRVNRILDSFNQYGKNIYHW